MPLNDKGKKIKRAMMAHYGPEKGERVFYASENAGKLGKVKRHKNYMGGSLPAYQAGTGLYGGLWKQLNPEGQKLASQQIEADPMARASARGGQQDNARRRQIMQSLVGQYGTGGGGGTTGVTTGAGGTSPEGQMNTLANFGSGLLDPSSDMSKRWMEQMREEIGDQTDAAQRAAAYQAAQSGFGAGASPELLQMQSDLGVSGLEAAGDAASDFMLRAPTLGVQAMGTSLGAGVGMRGQDLQSKLGSEANKLAREQMNAQLQMQQRSLDVQRELGLQDSAYGRELASLYSGVGGGSYGGQYPQRYSPGGAGGVRGTALGYR